MFKYVSSSSLSLYSNIDESFSLIQANKSSVFCTLFYFVALRFDVFLCSAQCEAIYCLAVLEQLDVTF